MLKNGNKQCKIDGTVMFLYNLFKIYNFIFVKKEAAIKIAASSNLILTYY